MTEDTALCYVALKGLPGPYIKHFMTELGHEGLNRLLDGFDTRAAEAVCTFAYSAGPGGFLLFPCPGKARAGGHASYSSSFLVTKERSLSYLKGGRRARSYPHADRRCLAGTLSSSLLGLV